jgi:hypothetical protein
MCLFDNGTIAVRWRHRHWMEYVCRNDFDGGWTHDKNRLPAWDAPVVRFYFYAFAGFL